MHTENTPFELIIFDLDGTLIDTMGGFADIAGELIAKNYGWSFELGRKRYLETSGLPFFQQLEILFPENSKNPDVATIFETRKIRLFQKETMSDRTVETLQWLRDHGYRTAISSNNYHDLVREFVQNKAIPIDMSLGFKPNFAKGQAHFNCLRDHFGVTFSAMLFIGDSLADAKIARDCGVNFVAKTGTFCETDFRTVENSHAIPIINEIHEFLTLLEAACKQSYWPPEQAAA